MSLYRMRNLDDGRLTVLLLSALVWLYLFAIETWFALLNGAPLETRTYQWHRT